jgi:hypothetical protein
MDETPTAMADVASVLAFRTQYRGKNVGPHYSGWLHFAFTTCGSIAIVVCAVLHVHAVRAAEWAMVPASFLVSNVAEYFGHKGPMHRRAVVLAILFQRHTLEHHRFFTHGAMHYESSRDFKMVLFPPVMLLFFFGLIAAPIGLVLYWGVSPNAAWLFVAVGAGYYLAYEWLHFAYHLNPRAWVGRLPFMGALRRHHTRHHDPALMNKCNFNITFPICDWVFGTKW